MSQQEIDRERSRVMATRALDLLDNPDVIDHFLGGECYALALAVSERTGWPVVMLTDSEFWGGPFHVAVRHPTGALLDISGMDSEFCRCFLIATDMAAADLRSFIDQGWLKAPAMHVARPFADALVSASLANRPETPL